MRSIPLLLKNIKAARKSSQRSYDRNGLSTRWNPLAWVRSIAATIYQIFPCKRVAEQISGFWSSFESSSSE